MKKDIRWHQRLANLGLVLAELTSAVEILKYREFTRLEELGLIQAFEYNYELAWNTIKDFYESQGETGIQGSRDTIRLAFKRGLIEKGELWMAMIDSRIMTSHTYNKEIAAGIALQIVEDFYPEFIKLHQKFNFLKNES